MQMWALSDAGICSMHDMRSHLTLEDVARAFSYLKAKADRMKQEEAKARAR